MIDSFIEFSTHKLEKLILAPGGLALLISRLTTLVNLLCRIFFMTPTQVQQNNYESDNPKAGGRIQEI